MTGVFEHFPIGTLYLTPPRYHRDHPLIARRCYNCQFCVVQASTENAEAFDRLNRRLDNEVKNFTAMVKEVATNIKIYIRYIIDAVSVWHSYTSSSMKKKDCFLDNKILNG